MVSAIATVLATSSNLPEAGIDFLKTLSVATFGHIVDTLERQQTEDQRESMKNENPNGKEKGKGHKGAISMMVDRILGQEDVKKEPVFLVTKHEENNMEQEVEDEEEFIQEEYDLQVNIEQIRTRLDSFDEFNYFASQVRVAIRSTQNPEADPSLGVYAQIVQQSMKTDERKNSQLQKILQTTRVQIKEQDDLPRQIVKVKR